MKKLADISSFERLQGNDNAGMVSDLSVFNGKDGTCFLAEFGYEPANQRPWRAETSKDKTVKYSDVSSPDSYFTSVDEAIAYACAQMGVEYDAGEWTHDVKPIHMPGADVFGSEQVEVWYTSKDGNAAKTYFITVETNRPWQFHDSDMPYGKVKKQLDEDDSLELDEDDPIELDEMGNELHPLSEDWQNNYTEDEDDDADYGYDNYGLDPDRYDGMDDNEWD